MKEMENSHFHHCRVTKDVAGKGLLAMLYMAMVFVWVSAVRPEVLEGMPIFTEVCRGLLLLGFFSFLYALLLYEGKWYDRFAYIGIAVQSFLIISFWYVAWGIIA